MTYSAWQQRQLDIETSKELDRRTFPACRCKVCGAEGHILCNRVPAKEPT